MESTLSERIRLLQDARSVWVKHYKLDIDPPASFYAFATFIGYPYEGQDQLIDLNNPRIINILEKIVGEHGTVVLKILEQRAAARREARDAED